MRPWMQAAMTYFYPRSPCGERPSARSLVASLSRQFLSTLSLRRATAGQFCPGRTFQISIHALLAESDRHCADTLWFRRHISIHALLAESDRHWQMGHRRARHFYPRSPCGERPAIGRRDRAGRDISIHALLAESDLLGRDDDMTQLEFLSTLSLRRATGCRCPPRHWHGGFLSTLSLRRATPERQ